jgi:hypothetical protein
MQTSICYTKLISLVALLASAISQREIRSVCERERESERAKSIDLICACCFLALAAAAAERVVIRIQFAWARVSVRACVDAACVIIFERQ